jgi:hypothetical protein
MNGYSVFLNKTNYSKKKNANTPKIRECLIFVKFFFKYTIYLDSFIYLSFYIAHAMRDTIHAYNERHQTTKTIT